MKKIIQISLSIIVIFSLVSCENRSSISNKLTTKADELSIEPGKTKLKDLVNNGFTY